MSSGGSHPGTVSCPTLSLTGRVAKGIPLPAPGALHMSKPPSAFPKFLYVARTIRDVTVNNLHRVKYLI